MKKIVKNIFRFSLVVAMMVVGMNLAKAQLLLVDTFAYANNVLEGNYPVSATNKWTKSAAAGSSSGTNPTLSPSALSYTSTGETYSGSNSGKQVNYTPVTVHTDSTRVSYLNLGYTNNVSIDPNEVLYVAFLVKFTSHNVSSYRDFFTLNYNSGNNVRGRLFAKANGADKIDLAASVNASATSANATDGRFTTINLNETALVVMRYHYKYTSTTDSVSFIVNPDLSGAEPTTGWVQRVSGETATASGINMVSLRQRSNFALNLGGLRVGKTWADVVTTTTGSGGEESTPEPVVIYATDNTERTFIAGPSGDTVFSYNTSWTLSTNKGADIAATGATPYPKIYNCAMQTAYKANTKRRFSSSYPYYIIRNTSTSVSAITVMGWAGSTQAAIPFTKISTSNDGETYTEILSSTYTVTSNLGVKRTDPGDDSCQYITVTGLNIPQNKYIKLETSNKAIAVIEVRLTPASTPDDDTPPVLAGQDSIKPLGNNVAIDAPIVATFDKNVKAGTGSIKLINETDANAEVPMAVSFSGTAMTITPTNVLINGKTYHVEIPAGSVTDLAGNAFAGIANTAWVFTTTNQLSDEKALTVLTLQGQRGASVYRNDSIFIAVAPTADLTKQKISGLTISDLAQASVNSLPIDVDSTISVATGDVAVKVTAQDASSKSYTLRVSNTAATQNELLTFKIGTTTGVIRNDSVLVKLPASTTDRSALVASFTCSQYAKVYAVVNAKDSLQTSGTTANDFTGTVIYKVKSEAGVENSYKVVTSVAPIVTGVLLTEDFDYDINTLLAGNTEGETSSVTGWSLVSQNSGAANPIYARVEAQNLEYAKDDANYIASGLGKAVHSYTPATAPSGGTWAGSGSVSILSRKEFANGAEASSGSVYAAFLLRVGTVSGSNTSATEVLSLYDPSKDGPLSRIWLRKGDGSTGKFFIGVSKNAAGSGLNDGGTSSSMLYPAPGYGNPGTIANNSLSPSINTTHLVVLKYSFNAAGNDTVSLFLNPTPGAAEPQPVVIATDGNDLNSIKGIIIREAGSTPSEFYVGGLRVATTWADAVAKAANNTNTNISSFTLPGASFKYSVTESLDTLLINTFKEENLSGVAPTITLEGDGATINPASGVAQNFSYTSYVKYTVTAADGSTKRDYYIRGDIAPYVINNEFNAAEGFTDDGATNKTVLSKQPISVGGIYTDSIFYQYAAINTSGGGQSRGDAGCSAGRIQMAGGANAGYIELKNLPNIGTISVAASSGSSDTVKQHAIIQIKEDGSADWSDVGYIGTITNKTDNTKECLVTSKVLNNGNKVSLRIKNNVSSTMYIYSLKVTSYNDKDKPVVTTYSPANSAADVALTATLKLTFNEKVQKGTGNITISDGTNNDVISVTSSQVVVSGNEVTITPTANLTAAKTYHVLIASGAIKDLSNNVYDGISNNATWNFQTISSARTGKDITKLSMKKADGSAVQKSAAVINATDHTVAVQLKYANYGSTKLKVDSILVSEGAVVDVSSTCKKDTLYTLAQLQGTNKSIVVEAENGSTQAWTLNVTVAPNDSADIKNFVIPSITHTTKFVKDTVVISTIGTVTTTGLVPTIVVSTGASINPASGVAQNFSYTSTTKYTVTAAAGNTKDWYVKFTEAAAPAFTSYGIMNSTIANVYGLTEGGSLAGTVDPVAKTVKVVLPYGADSTHLMAARFGLTDLAEAYVGTTKQDTTITLNSYALPLVYTIKAGSVQETWTVTATVKHLPALLVAETFDYNDGLLPGNKNPQYSSSDSSLYVWTPSQKAADALDPGLTIVNEALVYEPQGIPYIHSGEGKAVRLGDASTKHMDGIRYLSGANASEKIASGNIYASFMFHPDTATANWREFFEFVEGSTLGNAVRGRVWAKISSDKSKILVAATKTGNAPADAMAVELPRRTTSLVVLKYTYGYNGVNAAIAITSNPIPGTAEPASNMWKIYTADAETNSTGNYAVGILRQDASVKGTISGLRVALTWSDAVKAGNVEETGSDFTDYQILVSTPTGDFYRSGNINKTTKSISVNVPTGTSLEGLVAKFSLSYGATAYVGAMEQESDVTSNDFTQPLVYTVTPLIGSPATWTVEVKHDNEPNAVKKNTLAVSSYPNPATTYLQIDSEEEIALVEFYNLSGAKVMVVSRPGNYINIGQLGSGSYLVKFTSVSKKTMTIQIVK